MSSTKRIGRPSARNWNYKGLGIVSATSEMAKEPGYSPDISFAKFLLSEYGNIDFVIDLADSLIDFAKRFKKNNPKYQTALTMLKYGIPATVFTTQLMSKINKYRMIKSGKNTVFNEREEKIKQVMDIKGRSPQDYSLGQDDFNLGKDVVYWLFQKPKTDIFKILGFYTYDGLKPITDVWASDVGTMVISLEYDGVRFVWITNHLMSMTDEIIVRESTVYYETKNMMKKMELKGVIYKEFLNHFDVKNNILCLLPSGLHAFPRQVVKENVRQFNLERFTDEIRKVLKRKKKRGFAFVGIPGTGKSTIIRKLENIIMDYPIIYTTATNYSSQWIIQETFTTIAFMQPCIVIMEDLDSYDLRDKKSNLGVFLDQIDDVNNRLNAVFISTINDTSLVHYTLINRPGRFDQVIMVKPPQDSLEVYEVMHTRYDKNREADENIKSDFIGYEGVDKDLLKEVIANQYTQADICEIIEKALLLNDTVTNDSLKYSLQELKDSKDAIKKCNFKGEDPRNGYGEDMNVPTLNRTIEQDARRYANRA